jgi:DNA-binding beta-propeller fold protein YncE
MYEVASHSREVARTGAAPRPRFAKQAEPFPLQLPPGKQLGTVLSVARAPNQDLFLLHQCEWAIPVPPEEARLPDVVHFSPDGQFVDAWGGPDHIPAVDGVSQWPDGRENLECDQEGNIWIFGYKSADGAALKFSQDGKLLLRIGQRGRPGNDDNTEWLKGPTSCYHDIKNREVFIADGYGNHRIIAFNSDTGKFTRMWGAYGKDPTTLSPEESFGNPVHKIARAPDGRLYVCDRSKNRVQEFELIRGGAHFLREVVIGAGTMFLGAVWDITFTADGKFMYVADGMNLRVWSVDRDTFEVLGWHSISTDVEGEDNLSLHLSPLHRMLIEPNGDLLLARTTRGLKRLKFAGIW